MRIGPTGPSMNSSGFGHDRRRARRLEEKRKLKEAENSFDDALKEAQSKQDKYTENNIDIKV